MRLITERGAQGVILRGSTALLTLSLIGMAIGGTTDCPKNEGGGSSSNGGSRNNGRESSPNRDQKKPKGGLLCNGKVYSKATVRRFHDELTAGRYLNRQPRCLTIGDGRKMGTQANAPDTNDKCVLVVVYNGGKAHTWETLIAPPGKGFQHTDDLPNKPTSELAAQVAQKHNQRGC